MIVIGDELSQVVEPITTKLVLDLDGSTKEPLVQVHRNLVTRLKPHQVDGRSSPAGHAPLVMSQNGRTQCHRLLFIMSPRGTHRFWL